LFPRFVPAELWGKNTSIPVKDASFRRFIPPEQTVLPGMVIKMLCEKLRYLNVRPHDRRKTKSGTAACLAKSQSGLQREEMVEPSGIEPLTSCMPCRRSPS
jgi:hypothetical protein